MEEPTTLKNILFIWESYAKGLVTFKEAERLVEEEMKKMDDYIESSFREVVTKTEEDYALAKLDEMDRFTNSQYTNYLNAPGGR